MTAEIRARAPHSTEPSPIRNGKLYFRELTLNHKIGITALNALTGKHSEFTVIPVSIRPSSDERIKITFFYELPDADQPFGFHLLESRNSTFTLGNHTYIESHVGGPLVIPLDSRLLNNDRIEKGTDIAFDLKRGNTMIALAAHDVSALRYDELSESIKPPKNDYFVNLGQVRGV